MEEIYHSPRLFPHLFPMYSLAAVRSVKTQQDDKSLIFQKKKGFNELH